MNRLESDRPRRSIGHCRCGRTGHLFSLRSRSGRFLVLAFRESSRRETKKSDCFATSPDGGKRKSRLSDNSWCGTERATTATAGGSRRSFSWRRERGGPLDRLRGVRVNGGPATAFQVGVQLEDAGGVRVSDPATARVQRPLMPGDTEEVSIRAPGREFFRTLTHVFVEWYTAAATTERRPKFGFRLSRTQEGS